MLAPEASRSDSNSGRETDAKALPGEPEAQFKAIDTNDGGIILFKEFADWALKQKLDADGDADDSDLDLPEDKKENAPGSGNGTT